MNSRHHPLAMQTSKPSGDCCSSQHLTPASGGNPSWNCPAQLFLNSSQKSLRFGGNMLFSYITKSEAKDMVIRVKPNDIPVMGITATCFPWVSPLEGRPWPISLGQFSTNLHAGGTDSENILCQFPSAHSHRWGGDEKQWKGYHPPQLQTPRTSLWQEQK